MGNLPTDIKEINALSQELEIQKMLIIQKGLESGDPVEILKAQNSYFDELKKQTNPNIKSYLFDPFSFTNSLGFKDRPISLTYDTLRYMARTYVVRSVIETRKDQCARFAEFTDDDQKEGWTIRKKKKPFMTEADLKMSREDKKIAKDIATFILNAGTLNNKWYRDDFDMFIRKTIKDSLEIDQMTYEVVKDRRQKSIVEYFATDGATYRLANTSTQFKDKDIKGAKVNGYFPTYVQIYQNQIVSEFYPWELCFGIRNQQTNIKTNGYGISELEDLIKIVTWILNSDEYNGKFFCISGDSYIVTDLGIKKIKSLIDKQFQIFNGVEWKNAKAFVTGEKELNITKLHNGLISETSPDHKFLVIDDHFKGEPIWKKQSDLKIGDYCLVSNIGYENDLNYNEFFINKEYKCLFTNPTGEVVLEKPNKFIPSKEIINDVEFWEMIGFGLGDGHLGEHQLQIFPHYTKDKFILEKFGRVCERYNLNYRFKTINKKVKRSDGEFGYPIIAIYHKAFIDWLIDLGFKKSKEYKIIPEKIFSLPIKYRAALLRGLFSADGHTQNNPVHHYKIPSLHIQCNELRQSALQLLYSIGVATREFKYGKEYVGYDLRISDIDSFVQKVGYLQDYKNEGIKRANITKNKWDLLPTNVCKYLAHLIGRKNVKGYNKTTIDAVKAGRRILSRNKAIELLNEADLEIPWWLSYQMIYIEELIETGRIELMYDIEVFDDKHLFLANFIGVHNSQGSNPKGILKVAGNVSEPMLNQFKQAWYNQIVGVSNAWKIPVIQSDKMDWIDLQKNNTDMQFHLFSQYLRLIVCALYKMDPIEVGFRSETEGNQLFQRGKEKEFDKSNEKGLEPLLKFWESNFNKYIVSEITEDFEFAFTGVTPDDEQAILEADIKKLTNFEQLNEVRKRRGLTSLEDGDVVLNSAYLQYKQMKQMGSPDSNFAIDGYTGDSEGNAYSGPSDNPFENLEMSTKDRINDITEELIKASREISVINKT